MVVPLLDKCMEVNLRDYIDMVLDYLCLRQWAEVELGKVSTIAKKEPKKKKAQEVAKPGLDYYTFDSNGTRKSPMMNLSRLAVILGSSLMVMEPKG